jgi:alpha-beta hydrolase superfamily lysophospholipase
MTEQHDFESEEVTWEVDGIAVYGTLTRPTDRGFLPGIIFIAGSGPTDRDWCSPLLPGTNGSARLLADALTHKGFITLRYDKRAAGPHAQENIPRLIGKMSMQSHVDELAGAVDTLISHVNVDSTCVFVLTSSEGALHALNYQLQATSRRFKGLVLTGAPGRPVGQVARSQVLAQVAPLPNGDVLMKHYDDGIAAFVADKPVVPDAVLPEGVQTLLRSLTVPANLPFARELWSLNPADLIAKVPEPILVVIGKKDVQVDWKADGGSLKTATAKHDNVTFVYPENADHVLKYEERPREKLVAAEVAARYNVEGRVLDFDALTAILDWLTEQSQKYFELSRF